MTLIYCIENKGIARRLRILFILAFSILSQPIEAQEKLEREYRIAAEHVPEKAKSFIKATYLNAKAKWYREEGLSGFTLEAKLKWKGQRHSVEFDTLGNLQDIEIGIKFEEVEDIARKQIETHLQTNFQHYRIVKTQVQLKGSSAQLQRIVGNQTRETTEELIINYELIIKAKSSEDKINSFYEILVNKQGEVIKLSKIVERAVNHLIF
ncbi:MULTISPECIES: hypothetical protein [Olivibacter]|jgi:hypothetical protein|uniref:Outer membrane lipoprotein-sorting protein n=2 Tax=Olivibacter TaxID=376469 RepID=A0ABV6HLH0_9SPHI|nr:MULTISPECIES: hypothetical protein [Olivibacter]MCL4637424.1 hypothetical protein [Olivibacter sp. UJ_SKK_5.1]MDM8175518.1 hypothetical protein [Olivibacter sp. 47]MDX3914127.1 hypothetical protein [Pseudosphingobacterium sp.]QEL02269.1 hypothetical protein FKG96_16110 [Olivibacter sp. LS-1]